MLSRNWITIAASYVQRAWNQLLQSKDKKKKENLKRACVVSGILLFLLQNHGQGPSFNQKDKILNDFLEKIDLRKFGIFKEISFNEAFPFYIESALERAREQNLYVCHACNFVNLWNVWTVGFLVVSGNRV